jgi:hypothetical protein
MMIPLRAGCNLFFVASNYISANLHLRVVAVKRQTLFDIQLIGGSHLEMGR